MDIEIRIIKAVEGGFIITPDRYGCRRKYYAEDYRELSKVIKTCIEACEKEEALEKLEKEASQKRQEAFKAAEQQAYIEGLKSGKQKLRKNF